MRKTFFFSQGFDCHFLSSLSLEFFNYLWPTLIKNQITIIIYILYIKNSYLFNFLVVWLKNFVAIIGIVFFICRTNQIHYTRFPKNPKRIQVFNTCWNITIINMSSILHAFFFINVNLKTMEKQFLCHSIQIFRTIY